MHPTEIWYGKSLEARVLRGLLTPLSWLYTAGWQGYLAFYKLGIKKPKERHRPVVVVGNLTTGGMGKTPVTIYVARVLQDLGEQVVISCSGYGSPRSQDCAYAPEGELDVEEWGDEATMLRWFLPDVELVVGRHRVWASRFVHNEYPDAVMLMDDGFQHLPVKKHVSIVLEEREPANTMCIPAGPYREPRSNLKRADGVVWVTPSDLPSPPNPLPPGAGEREFLLKRYPLRLTDPSGEEVTIARATALCAIGSPERFLGDLRERLEVIEPLVLGDHDPLTSGNLLERLPPDLPVIVTAKDWVKLRARKDVGTRQFVIALQDVRVEPEAEFRAWLAQKLNESKAKQESR